MNPLLLDTSPAQAARYFELLRALSPAQRMRIVSANSRRVRTMAEAGVRLRNPGATEAEVRAEVVELLYGSEVRERLGRKHVL